MRKSILYLGTVIFLVFAAAVLFPIGREGNAPVSGPEEGIVLPQVRTQGGMSLGEAIAKRRSLRSFTEEGLTLADVSQILWAAQGITDPAGLRSAPSAGALYPLEVYVIAGRVGTLAPGIYHYDPGNHTLCLRTAGDLRDAASRAALSQSAVKQAPAVVLITAVPARTTVKYGERGTRYVFMEAGHAAQNVCLQAVALDLGAVTIGAFDDTTLMDNLHLNEPEIPLYLIPVGHPR